MEKQQLQILFLDAKRGWIEDTLEVEEIDSLRIEQNAQASAAIREIKT